MKNYLIVIMLCLSIVVGSPNLCAAVASASNQLRVVDIGHGQYQIEQKYQGKFSSPQLRYIRKIDEDIYQIENMEASLLEKDYDKLLRVKDDTFIRVKEIKLALDNSSQVEAVIAEYDFSPDISKDIRTLSEQAISQESNIELLIYTPRISRNAILQYEDEGSILGEKENMVAANGWTRDSSSYYTGYMNYKYYDEVFKINNISGFQTVKSGSSVKSFLTTTLTNIGIFLVGKATDSITGGAYSLVTLFGSGANNYPANTNDLWQANLHETKYRKYTSIQIWDGRQYAYVVRAMADKGTMYFEHYLARPSVNVDTRKNSPQTSFKTPNYDTLDRKAYAYMNDVPYTEKTTSWKINNLTSFSSVN